MKRVLLIVLCAALAFSFTGCARALFQQSQETGSIESLPYQVPYYDNITLDLLSVDLYQQQMEIAGKDTYNPVVIVKFDPSNLEEMSDDDKYWAEEQSGISVVCNIWNDANEVTREEMESIGRIRYDDGYTYYAFTLRNTDSYGKDKYFFENFDSFNVQLLIHIGTSLLEDDAETHDYFASTDSAPINNSFCDEIVDAIESETSEESARDILNELN